MSDHNVTSEAEQKKNNITQEMLEALKNSKTIEDFTKRHVTQFLDINLKDYLVSILQAKKLKKADVIKASNLSEVYAYQIFSGVKNPSRDKLLSLAVAMKLSFEECQRLLKLAAVNELYVKNRRDAIVIFGLMKGLDVLELNDLLYELEEFTLQ